MEENENDSCLERSSKVHKILPNSTPSSSLNSQLNSTRENAANQTFSSTSSSSSSVTPSLPSTFTTTPLNGNQMLNGKTSFHSSMTFGSFGGMSGHWGSGLLSQQLSGNFGSGGLTSLLSNKPSSSISSLPLSSILSSNSNSNSHLHSPPPLPSSSSSLPPPFPPVNKHNNNGNNNNNNNNSNNNNMNGNKTETKETEENRKKKNPTNLKIKTRRIPEEPIEEQEIEAEFEQMRVIMKERGLDLKTDPDAFLPENSSKNRYRDVLPNKATSVKIADGTKGGTYINANYVSDRSSPNAQKYICCQAPLTNTFADFWTMIWEKNCPVIVMLTRLEERNLVKADVYWPEEGKSRLFGGIMVTHKKTKILKRTTTSNSSKKKFGGFFERKEKKEMGGDNGFTSSSIFKTPMSFNSHASFSSFGGFNILDPGGSLSNFGSMANLQLPLLRNLSNNNNNNNNNKETENTIVVRKFSMYDVRDPGRTTRELTQLHYMEWPDFGVPDSTEQMSDLIKELDIRKRGLDDPIVVHCSAGIGRTGTFLAIHMALQQVALGAQPIVDVFETVVNLRIQRNGMVQSKDQYKFVYVTIKDMLMDKYNSVSKSKRNNLLNKTQTNIDHIRTFIDKVPRNRPTRSASEPIIENHWKKLIDEDEFPSVMDQVKKKLSKQSLE